MFKLKTVQYFDVHDLQKYIKSEYGKDLDLIKSHAEYSGNNTIVKIDVNKEYPDEPWYPTDTDLEDKPDLALQRWLEGDDSVNANENLILWDMCRKGLIPSGEYIMDTWW